MGAGLKRATLATIRTTMDEGTLARIRELRGRGLHQDEIAERVGVAQQTISRYLAAERAVFLAEEKRDIT